jgi:hypothetical protein
MTKDGTDRVFETTLAALRECRDRMDFPPCTRQEAEARFRLVQRALNMPNVSAAFSPTKCQRGDQARMIPPCRTDRDLPLQDR